MACMKRRYIASAMIPTLNGVPASSPSGTGASVVPPQHRQQAAYWSTRVTTGATLGKSILS